MKNPGWALLGMLVWLAFIPSADRTDLRIAILLLGGIWVFWRIGEWKVILVVLAFCQFAWFSGLKVSSSVPENGEFQITQIRKGYAIAQNSQSKVIVYEPDSFWIDQKVLLSEFEEIHSLTNLGVFSFSQFMEGKNIRYCAKKAEAGKEDSPLTLKGKLYVLIREHPAKKLFRLLMYGITDDENLQWISSLGLGWIALMGIVRKILSRFVMKKTVGWIALGLQGILLAAFPFQVSIVRMMTFTFSRQIVSDWKYRWPLGVFLFVLICPDSLSQMAFVLPAGISFLSHFAGGTAGKKVCSALWCALCQMVFSGQVSLIMLVFFMGFRTIFGWFFLISLPGLVLPAWALWLEKILSSVMVPADVLTIHGTIPFWYGWVLGIGMVWMLWKKKNSRIWIMTAVFCLYPWIWRMDPFFHVYQMDVGQGDCTIVTEPFSKRVFMIDAAGRFNHDLAEEVFVPFLKSRQIRKIDALIVTHDDFDHSGSVQSLCSQFPVADVIRDYSKPIRSGCQISLLLEKRQADPDDENDKSLITHFAMDGFRYLYTGDASIGIEKQLIESNEIDVDILKLGHHGSSTSSDRDFLQETSPKLALISAGYQNRYGHPSNSVLALLNELGIDRLNTADHGQIHLFSLPGILFFETADGLNGVAACKWRFEKR